MYDKLSMTTYDKSYKDKKALLPEPQEGGALGYR